MVSPRRPPQRAAAPPTDSVLPEGDERPSPESESPARNEREGPNADGSFNALLAVAKATADGDKAEARALAADLRLPTGWTAVRHGEKQRYDIRNPDGVVFRTIKAAFDSLGMARPRLKKRYRKGKRDSTEAVVEASQGSSQSPEQEGEEGPAEAQAAEASPRVSADRHILRAMLQAMSDDDFEREVALERRRRRDSTQRDSGEGVASRDAAETVATAECDDLREVAEKRRKRKANAVTDELSDEESSEGEASPAKRQRANADEEEEEADREDTETTQGNATSAAASGDSARSPEEENDTTDSGTNDSDGGWHAKRHKKWLEMFERLKAYKEENGDPFVPIKFKADRALGSWVNTQRTQMKKFKDAKKSAMTQERMDMLTSIGFGTEVKRGKPKHIDEKHEQKWLEALERLKRYKEEHGNLCVPRHWPEDPSFAKWVTTQRYNVKRFLEKKHSSMTQERFDMLVEVGLATEEGPAKERNRAVHDGRWNERFEQLTAYKLAKGHCDVSLSKDEAEWPGLASWVGSQMLSFKARERGQPSSLTDEKIMKLAGLGFKFRRRDDWDMRFNQLVDYREKYGNTRVPVCYKGHNKLGAWVRSQRVHYHRRLAEGKMFTEEATQGLNESRIARLNEIGFDWEMRRRGIAGRGDVDPVIDGISFMPK